MQYNDDSIRNTKEIEDSGKMIVYLGSAVIC